MYWLSSVLNLSPFNIVLGATDDESCWKVSKVITKSKFGAPKHKKISSSATISNHHVTTSTVGNHKRKSHQALPSISTLQALPSSLTKNLMSINSGNILMSSRDTFNNRVNNKNVDIAYGSVVTLTPPSSPDRGTSSRERVETVTEDVEDLVDEHFRNCGYDSTARSGSSLSNISDSSSNSSSKSEQNEFSTFIQKFLQSQV